MKKLQADHREEVKALAKKHRNRDQFTRVKQEAASAVVCRGVSEREKLGQLFENRKEELQRQHELVKDLLKEQRDKVSAINFINQLASELESITSLKTEV